MQQSLIIFSGLPGTGKTTLARWLSTELNWPLERIDDVVETHALHTRAEGEAFWSQMIAILLGRVEAGLKTGSGIIVDSVFMGTDRSAARRLSRHYRSDFFAIHTHCSDEELWRARVEERMRRFPQDNPATWEQILEQRKHFHPWDSAEALFIDSADLLETNTWKILKFLKATEDQRSFPP